MMRPGDWHCASCQHLNFSRRDACQRCSSARPGSGGGGGGGGVGDGGSQGRRPSGSSGYGFGSSYGEAGKGGGGRGGGYGMALDGSVRPGDWYCSASNCGAHNFASRSCCYKCGLMKEEGGGVPVGEGGLPAGSARGPRSSYGFGAPGGGGASGTPQGWKAGDWICERSGCTEHNFASRMECYRCNAPRPPDFEVTAM